MVQPRSLADDLRGRSDDALAELLELRPDLAVPPPPDISTLATAAAGRLSVQRAVDGLDRAALQVLEVLAVLPEPSSAAEVTRRWGAPAASPLERLRHLALVWGGSRSLRLVRAARDSLGPYPAGLGPPLADALDRRSPQRLAELLDDLGLPPTGDPDRALRTLAEHLGRPQTLHELLDAAPPGSRQLLDRLTWGPPVGRIDDADRQVRAGTASSAVEWLLAHGVLAVADAGHVVLPREIALTLRGGRVHREPESAPRQLAATSVPARQVDGAAAGAAAESVRLVDDLVEAWGSAPPPVLRTGGLGVRDLRRAATMLEVDETTAALVIEVAFAAGLIADDGEADPSWLPTPGYDAWRAGSTGRRWEQLATGWLATSRIPGLVGSRDGRDSPITALGPDAERPAGLEIRTWVLQQLGTLTADGVGPQVDGVYPALTSGPLEADPLLAALAWSAPRRSGTLRQNLVRWTLRETAWLGLTGGGAVSRHGAALLKDAGAAEILDAALPAPVDTVLLQADLTAIAPGPLVPELAREIGLAADVASRGGATVYRFSPGSVRRALDAGRSGEELLALLTAHSSTPVPQPLAYLITDTARRYGKLRVGAASAYLRADDESVLAELLVERRAAPLRLRRLAATVLAAQAAPQTVLQVLREIGLAPASESAEGDLLVHRAEQRRAPRQRLPRRGVTPPPPPGRDDLLAAVRAMRAADPGSGRNGTGRNGLKVEEQARTATDVAVTPMDPAQSLALLRDAIAARRDVWIGYLEDADRPIRRLITPLELSGGRVIAMDAGTGTTRAFSAHRIIAVAIPADQAISADHAIRVQGTMGTARG